MTSETDTARRRVLVLAPTGRDAELTITALAAARIEGRACRSIAQLAAEIGRGAGAAILAEEALEAEDVAALVAALEAQPSWSDLPLLVMTSDEAGAVRLMSTVAARTNVTILQRPTGRAMLVSVVQSALRSRERQYETRDLLERLREADRQKDAFLATISHELRTPLNAILGWTRMLRGGALDAAQRERAIETIERNASAQTTIIEDILDVSRIIAGKVRLEMHPVDLRHVVLEAVESVLPAARARAIALETSGAADAIPVMGDAARLQQIAWNLLSNAVKFTPKGGRVDVDVREVNGEALVRVTDTGRGIEPAFLPHLFERFRQADSSTTRKYGGLGLGLAIVRHLVELHGGLVRAESGGEGQGAMFEVRLPAGARAAEGVELQIECGWAEEALRTGMPSLAGVHVLVVDDNLDAIELTRMLLASFGAEVRVANSAEDALAEVRAWRPDVLVSDIAMPGRDGFWLVEQVRLLAGGEGGGTPAVALTAFADRDDQSRALLAGFQRHLRKPVSPGELAVTVATLAGRSPRAS
jgi:signal transduction histidine kinase/ActR/RegA family two-component response regulator